MSINNCNGYNTDSFDLYKSEKNKGGHPDSERERVLRGFQKSPVVVCERLDITPLLKMQQTLEEPTFVAVDQVANFSKKCSVRLKRENLLKLKEIFMKRNSGSNVNYACNICQKVYMSEKKLLNHQENKHVICYKPENKIRKKVSFSDEIIVHEVKEYHRCRKCPKIYEDYDSLKGHMKEIHKKRRCYICFYCSKDFVDRTFFKVHIKLHCDSCGLLLPSKKLYMEHRRYTCKTVKKYECKTCHISLFHFLDLKDHSYEHLGQFYICDICKDRFDDKCAVSHHIKFLHSKRRPNSLYTNYSIGTESVYKCNFCELTTIERVMMEKHVSTFPEYGKCAMTGYKDFYFCDQCFEKFGTETDMLQHKWTHFLNTTTESNSPKPVTLLNTDGFTNNAKQNILYNKKDNTMEVLVGSKIRTPIKMFYNINETLPEFFQPRVVVEKLILPQVQSCKLPVNFSDVTNLDLNILKKPIINRKKTKRQCELCLKYLSSNYNVTRHMLAVHGIKREGITLNCSSNGSLHCNVCEEDFALPSLLNSHNCIRTHSPQSIKQSQGDWPDPQLTTSVFSQHNDFDDINIDDDEDYMNSIDFDIPAPIVEFTEFDNVTLVINGGDGQMNNAPDGGNDGQLYNEQLTNVAVTGNDRQLYSEQNNAVSSNVSELHNAQLIEVAVSGHDRQLYDGQLNSVAVGENDMQLYNTHLSNVTITDDESHLYNAQSNNVALNGNTNGTMNNIAVNSNKLYNTQLNNNAVNDMQCYNGQLNDVAVNGSGIQCFTGQLNVVGKQHLNSNLRYVITEVPIEF